MTEQEQIDPELDGALARDAIGHSINRAIDNGSGVAMCNLEHLRMVVQQRDDLQDVLSSAVEAWRERTFAPHDPPLWVIAARLAFSRCGGLIAMTPPEHSAAPPNTTPQ